MKLVGYITCFSKPSFKKLIGSKQLVNSLAIVATPRDLMCCSGMSHIFYGSVQHLQTPIHHFSLYKSGATVIFSMENDIGCCDLVHVFNRRFPLQNFFCFCLPGISTEIPGHQSPGIPFAEKCREIIYPPLRTGSFKAMIMSNHPCHEISTI